MAHSAAHANRQNLIAAGEDALSDATSCFAGSRDDRIAPLREARKIITKRMNKYAHVFNRLRPYTTEQREGERGESTRFLFGTRYARLFADLTNSFSFRLPRDA